MLGDLAALFDSVDGYVEDAKELGVAGASAIAATVVWGKVSEKLFAAAPQVFGIKGVKPLTTAVAGIVIGSMVSRYNRTAGLGVGIGLVTSAMLGAVSEFQIPVPGLSGVGNDVFDNYLSGATTTLEPVAGFSGAPTTLEPVAGFAGAPTYFEEVAPNSAPVGSFLS